MSEWRETDFGRIPKEWDLKKVADIKSEDKRAIAMGPFGSNIKAENFVEYGVPVIRGTNLNYAKYVDGVFVYLTEEKANDLLGSNCKAGDLVFTHRGTIGQVGLIPSGKFPRYVISQSGMKLTVNSNLMDSDFLFYFFKSDFGQYQILKYESQVGVPSISNPLTSLKEIEVPAPPLPEQKAIAAALSSLDDKIDLLHRQNLTLEAMAETLFRQRFLVEAREDWEDGILGDLVEFNYGKTLRDQERGGYGFPVYGSSGIVGYHNEYLVKAPGIITGRKGTLGVINYSFHNFFPIDTTFYITSKTKSGGLFFEYFLLKTLKLGEMNSDSAVPGLNKNLAHGIQLTIPPISLIEKFNRQAKPLFKKLNINQIQIQTLKTLRDTLLPKLMSGEVRVKLTPEETHHASLL